MERRDLDKKKIKNKNCGGLIGTTIKYS